jgi:hypothetical protein
MRFTEENAIPVRDRRRKRKANRWGALLGTAGVVLVVLADARVIVIFPLAWHPYIVGGGLVAGALGLLDRLERRADARRYLDRLSQRFGDEP